MSKAQHTPTPWTKDYPLGKDDTIWIKGADGTTICLIYVETTQREELDNGDVVLKKLKLHHGSHNAAYIVKCVNLHDELVEALGDLVARIYRTSSVDEQTLVSLDKARALLAKARDGEASNA